MNADGPLPAEVPDGAATRLQFALDAGALGDWSWDAATDRVVLSPRACALFGVSPAGVPTWTALRELLHPDDREPARAAVERALAAHADYGIEYRVPRGDGTVHWVAAKGRGVYGSDGAVLGMVGIVQDVTERRRAEEALREETRVLEVLNDTGRKLASSLELQALVQVVTDAATEITGARFGSFFYNVTDEQGDAFLLFALSGAPREAFARFGNPRATPLFGPTFNGEPVIRCDDVLADPRYGQWAPHRGMPPGHLPVRSYLAVPVVSRSGEVIGGLFFGHPEVGVFGPRSERLVSGIAAQAAVAIDNARLYEQAQRAAREKQSLLEREQMARLEAERVGEMKDNFLATLSHELRAPLSSILGWAHILRSGPPTPEDLAKGIEVIERNTRAQAQLIDDLLDMSSITSGKIRLDIQPLTPLAFVEAAIETVAPAAEAKGIRIERMLDPAAGPIAGDPNRLQQIIWNLLSNAIKFTPRGGKVQVLLQRVNSHIEITVADTGIGIEPDFVVHVFDRFRQADASMRRRHGGLGLGLSIVKHLVELHGGTVRARSAGAGKGATFAVHLPVSVVQPGPQAGPREHPETALSPPGRFDVLDLSGLKVLVVDDEPDARELVQRVLAECGAEVHLAGNAEEAVAIVQTQRPQILVSDIGMPDVDGFELLRRIRHLGPEHGGNLPAIALTAFARSEDRTRALRAGFLVHVSKPVEPAEIVATVGSVAGRTGPHPQPSA